MPCFAKLMKTDSYMPCFAKLMKTDSYMSCFAKVMKTDSYMSVLQNLFTSRISDSYMLDFYSHFLVIVNNYTI
jgi:hypothetical protein